MSTVDTIVTDLARDAVMVDDAIADLTAHRALLVSRRNGWLASSHEHQHSAVSYFTRELRRVDALLTNLA